MPPHCNGRDSPNFSLYVYLHLLGVRLDCLCPSLPHSIWSNFPISIEIVQFQPHTPAYPFQNPNKTSNKWHLVERSMDLSSKHIPHYHGSRQREAKNSNARGAV